MSELIAYGNQVNNIFQLIGNSEDDITKSIAWALCNCPIFLQNIIFDLIGISIDPENVIIRFQENETNKGRTDLELTDNKLFYIIIEAKKGWLLPQGEQLTMYSERKNIQLNSAKHKAIVSMSECSISYANAYLPFHQKNGIPIFHLPWRTIYDTALKSKATSNNAQKHLLDELMLYLEGIMTMQTKDSNWVYVVSLSSAKPENCNITWIDIVKKAKKYFHPLGINGWPKEPPNYIAFRYKGQLQSIHHIEKYTVTKNLHNEIPNMPDYIQSEDYFVYDLGTPIIPNKVVKTGKIYANGRKWAMLDTLLTADTISEASDISYSRK